MNFPDPWTPLSPVPQGRWASFFIIFATETRDYDQYYGVAAATIFFYDYFLTLADEVSHLISVSVH